MITPISLPMKKFSKIAVPAMLAISVLALTEKEAVAVPLEPILDQVGRRMVEGLLGVNSGETAVLPASQSFTDTQAEKESDPENLEEIGSPALNTQEITNSAPVAPVYYPPTAPQSYPATPPQAYPSGYATYPSSTYPPAYPTIPPSSAPVAPAFSPPTYPPTYPATPPQAYPSGYATYPSSTYSPTYPTVPPNSAPVAPTYSPPTYPLTYPATSPQAYPSGYATYPSSTYSPTYPTVPPNFTPVAPHSPQAYPSNPPMRSSSPVPVIINNF